MTKLKCIVFDVDGTLLNSRELIVAAYQHVAREYDLPVPTPEAIHEKLAQSLPIRQIIEELFPNADHDQLLETKTQFIGSNYLMMEGYAGLHDLLEKLQERGLRLAVFTGGNSSIVGTLEHHEIAGYFSSIVHSERVGGAKPDPEGFLLAVSDCGVRPNEAIMVGDSPNDILTGKNSKALATVGITHGNGSRGQLEAAGADYIINSLSELPEVLAIIEQL